MKFIKGVPDILVSNEFEITTVQYFDEDEDQVVLRFAEYIPQFIRGYVCDMEFKFSLIDGGDYMEGEKSYYSHAKGLVLVHIRKNVDMDSAPQFEYVFYK